VPAYVQDMRVKSWPEADQALREIANGRELLRGVGNSDPPNAVIALTLDALSGEGCGYRWYQTDANGRPIPQDWGYIYVR
jgi:hypothetical protein